MNLIIEEIKVANDDDKQVKAVNQAKKTQTATASQQKADTTKTNQKKQSERSKDSFADLSLTADSALVWDTRLKKPVYAYNSKKEQPLASLTKLMTALVATQEYTKKATTTINAQHLDAHGEYGLAPYQVWSLDQLIDFMLIESANDAARAVATAGGEGNADKGYSKQFVEKMNQTATNLNLNDTYFFNPSGLDINEDLISGGYGTAKDITRLFAHIQNHHPHILSATKHATVTVSTKKGINYTAENTNKLVDSLPKTTGSKTGYTVLAGGNLVMGFDFNRPIIITILGSTKDGRFTDMKKLYKQTRTHIQNNEITSN
jgi:D-alanyl-D-alanine carboxypeptidase